MQNFEMNELNGEWKRRSDEKEKEARQKMRMKDWNEADTGVVSL